MKKNGFTLAETLVTIGIVGIAAVLIAPSLVQLLPDRNKMEFMECYKQLTVAIPLLGNHYTRTMQWDEQEQRFYPTCVGLACNTGSDSCDEEIEEKIGCVLNRMVGIEGKYTWTGNSVISSHDPLPPNYPKSYQYAKSHTVTCEAPNNKFEFKLDGNGSIKDIGVDGRKYMKDPFNYHKSGDEDEEN